MHRGMRLKNLAERRNLLGHDPGSHSFSDGRQLTARAIAYYRPLLSGTGNPQGAGNHRRFRLGGFKMEGKPAMPGFDLIKRPA